MSGKKVYRVEDKDSRSEYAKFMGGEKLYENMLTFTDLNSGNKYEVPFVYRPATAFMLSEIYADIDKDMSVDEQFERFAQLLQVTIIDGPKFVNVPEGTARYELGEISVQDLTSDQKAFLETCVAEGVGKSREDVIKEVKATRRLVGKGIRKAPVGTSEPPI